MTTTDPRKRHLHAQRVACAVNSDLSSAFGQLEAAALAIDPAFRQLTYEIEKIQRRVTEIAEAVQ